MLRSNFCLAPPGWERWTIRLFEAVAVGCIPVVCADAFVPPFAADVDWSFAIFFNASRIAALPNIIRNISADEITQRRQKLLAQRPRLSWRLDGGADAAQLAVDAIARVASRAVYFDSV